MPNDQMTRHAAFQANSYNLETRTFTAVIATSAPVMRHDAAGPFSEVLPAEAFDLSAQNLTLLDSHNTATVRAILGRTLSIRRDGEMIVAEIQLSSAEDVAPVGQRIKDGTLTGMSIGYRVSGWTTRREGGKRIRTAAAVHLTEVTLTSNPADPNAGVRQSKEGGMPKDTQDDRATLIQRCRTAHPSLTDDWATRMEEAGDVLTDEEVINDARETVLTGQQTRAARVIRTVAPVNDNPAEIQTRAAGALIFRMSGGTLPEASREYAHMTLMDHARASLQRAGIASRGLSPDEVLHRALTTSDFPLTVANAAGKVALEGYKTAESALKPLFRQRSLSDFKTSTGVRLAGFGKLEELSESGEIKATSGTENGETLKLRTFARRLDLSRQLILNDDLGLFADTTRALGEAAAATEAQLMVDLLTGSDVLSDGTVLFHASRSNIVSNGGTLVGILSDARLKMRQQKGLDGVTPIQAIPRFVICGPEKETDLEQILAMINPSVSDDVNPFAGKMQLLVEPRLTGDDFYVFADPAQCAVFNLATFAAAPGPQIQRQESWGTLGTSFRCWLDCGVGFAGWRGAIKVA